MSKHLLYFFVLAGSALFFLVLFQVSAHIHPCLNEQEAIFTAVIVLLLEELFSVLCACSGEQCSQKTGGLCSKEGGGRGAQSIVMIEKNVKNIAARNNLKLEGCGEQRTDTNAVDSGCYISTEEALYKI